MAKVVRSYIPMELSPFLKEVRDTIRDVIVAELSAEARVDTPAQAILRFSMLPERQQGQAIELATVVVENPSTAEARHAIRLLAGLLGGAALSK